MISGWVLLISFSITWIIKSTNPLFTIGKNEFSIRDLILLAGGIFLIYLAWASYRQWRQQATTETGANDSAPRTLLQAATVNILNPNPYLGWSLVLGPAVLAAWHQNPANAVALIIAFYATIITVMACTILLFGTTRFLGPGGRRTLILMSAVTLAAIGMYRLAASLLQAG